MAVQVQFRRGTAAEWTSVNPVLAQGEAGYEHDTGKFKVYNFNSPAFKSRDKNKKNYILTLVDDNNFKYSNFYYFSTKNCITYDIIEDLFLCSAK